MAELGLPQPRAAGQADALEREGADDAGDAVTANLLTRITSEADKQLWFVESHLENS